MARSRRQRLGQHFLADSGVVARIVRALDDEPERVLEIGPGRGVLTRALAARMPRVVAVEADERLVAELPQRVPEHVEVVAADALRVDLDELCAADAPWQVAANLPYSVGTAIVRRLLPRADLFTRLVVMLQKEVAERLVAAPGQRAHGLLALERAAYGRARLAFDVPRRAFRPPPKVTSAVVVVDLEPAEHDPEQLARALTLAGHALRQRRKMLANAIAPLAEREQIEAAAADPRARPGELGLDAWLRLAAVVSSKP